MKHLFSAIILLLAHIPALAAGPMSAGDRGSIVVPFFNNPASTAPIEGAAISVSVSVDPIEILETSFLGPASVFPGCTTYFRVDFRINEAHDPSISSVAITIDLTHASPGFLPAARKWVYSTRNLFRSMRGECVEPDGVFCGEYLSPDVDPPFTTVLFDGPEYTDEASGIFIATHTFLDFISGDSYLVDSRISASSVTAYLLNAPPGAFEDMTPAGTAFTLPGGVHSVYFASRDHAGNTEAIRSTTVIVDAAAPIINISSPAAGEVFAAGRGAVAIAFSVTDDHDPAPFVEAFLVQAEDTGSPRGEKPAVIPVASGRSFDPLELDDGVWELTVSAADFVLNAGYASGGFFEVVHATRPAVTIRLEPATLNLKSQGQYVSAYLEPAEGILPETLRITAVNGRPITPIPPVLERVGKNGKYKHVSIGDADGDGIEDLSVKFDRAALIAVISAGEQVSITLEGGFGDGGSFSAETFIRAISPGRAPAGTNSVITHPFARLELPKESLKADSDISIARLGAEPPLLDRHKNSAALKHGLKRLGKPYEFGPAGLRFDRPVAITLPYDKAAVDAGEEARLAYWNAGAGRWDLLPSEADARAGTVTGWTDHFSVYQVLAAPTPAQAGTDGTGAPPEEESSPASGPDEAFRLGEVYVFPNPALRGAAPTFHIECGVADSVRIAIFAVSGRRVHEHTITGLPAAITDGNGLSYAYEYAWRDRIPSGVYYYLIEAAKSGQKLKKTGKFAVVR
ncbi:MAG: hypothetical protein AB1734_02120 [Elusimicrobiota bacterium]